MSDSTPTLTVDILLSTPSKADREYCAFLRLLPELLKTHRGRYVAVHDGALIDADADDIALVQRVHNRIGYVPIHVGLVADPLPVARVPHYRQYRTRA